MGWEYTLKAWVTTQIIFEISTKRNTSGCQGREVEFLEEENVRHFAGQTGKGVPALYRYTL